MKTGEACLDPTPVSLLCSCTTVPPVGAGPRSGGFGHPKGGHHPLLHQVPHP